MTMLLCRYVAGVNQALQVTLLLLSNSVFITDCKLIISYNENSVKLVENMYSQQNTKK